MTPAIAFQRIRRPGVDLGLRETDGGSIINISSAGALRPRPQIAPCAGAKAALNALTEAFAHEYAPKVRVNTISPGRFLTDVSKAWPEEHKKNATAAAKRSGQPEESVTAALYLASSASSFTTGSLVRVDGELRRLCRRGSVATTTGHVVPYFIARIMLHGANEADYQGLHNALRAERL